MLGKLIKYDIRSTWRDFAGIYLAILIAVIFLPIVFVNVNNTIINVTAGFAITGISIATVVVMIIMLFKIFNTNVFSKQGFLTMTLPTRGSEIVASKLIVSTMWIVLTGLVATIGIMIFVSNIAPMGDFFPALKKGFSLLSGNEYLAIVLALIAIIVAILKEVAKLFLACCVAHLKLLGRLRVPLGILSFFVLSWLEIQVLKLVGFIADHIPWFDEFGQQMTIQYNSLNLPEDIFQLTGMFNLVTGLWIFYSLILTIVFSIGTIWFLNHKLELE